MAAVAKHKRNQKGGAKLGAAKLKKTGNMEKCYKNLRTGNEELETRKRRRNTGEDAPQTLIR